MAVRCAVVDVLTLVVLIEKEALLEPPMMVTLVGTTAAALSLESDTTAPPAGAAKGRTTVPLTEVPAVTRAELRVRAVRLD